VMLGISPLVIHRVTSGLGTFSSDDDSDSDIDLDDPSNYPILWGPEDEVYHDNALVNTMPGPSHVPVNRLINLASLQIIKMVSVKGLWPALGPPMVCFSWFQQGTPLLVLIIIASGINHLG
jgi:hypothetical protein